KSINKYFSKYMIFSSKQEHNRMANGNVVQILNSTSQSNIYFATPNLLEQQKIANFLDEKSKIFDEAISKKEQLISKLELAKQSLISEVVTGKLKVIEQNSKLQTIKREKNELKSSGVEWLGDIPKDWQVKKLKYLVNNLNNRRIPIESSIRGNMKNSIYDYYGATGIIDKVDNYIFDEPTIVLAEDGANLIFRNIKLVYLADGKYWVNNHAHILSTKDNSSRIYLYHLLEIYDYLPIISGSAQPKLTKESLMNISLPYPSLEEQQKISKYLDEKLIHFDNTIEKTKQSITKLKEAKEALISQAVTGKIEVL
ncbi:restriction endonuclease subunit S, partial [Aliarcobacter butzleri]